MPEPKLAMDEQACWSFYVRFCRAFIRDFNLMPDRIRETNLSGPELSVFLDRLCVIHDGMLEMAAERVNVSADHADLAIAEDPT